MVVCLIYFYDVIYFCAKVVVVGATSSEDVLMRWFESCMCVIVVLMMGLCTSMIDIAMNVLCGFVLVITLQLQLCLSLNVFGYYEAGLTV